MKKKVDKAVLEKKKYYKKMNPAIESIKIDLNEYTDVLGNYFKELGYDDAIKVISP